MAHVGEELRLVLARFRELPALILDFVEQPHVLDRDHRLVGEGDDQLNLLFGERPHPRTPQDDHADGRPFAYQRDAQPRAKAGNPLGLVERPLRIGEDIGNMNCAPLRQYASCQGTPATRNGRGGREVDERLRQTIIGRKLEIRTLRAKDARHVGFAQPRRRFHQRIEHGLQVERRAADDLEHVGRRGLLLQRFA